MAGAPLRVLLTGPPGCGKTTAVVRIDEIGKMECFSGKFIAAIRRLLKSDKSVLATVAQKGPGLIQQVKSYPGVELLHLTRENRDDVAQRVADRLVSSK